MPRSLRSLPRISALEQVLIAVDLPDRTEARASLRCILRSVLSLPSLTSLDILVFRQPSGCYRVPELVWTDDELPSPVSLRHLTLRHVSLSAASFRRVCFLPLDSLEVKNCPVEAGDDAALVSATQSSACTVKELLHFGSPSRGLVSAIGSHALQLRELSFKHSGVEYPSGQAWDLSPLMTDSGAPRLPHLTKLTLFTTTWEFFSCSDLWQPGLQQACTTASQQLVAAYCGQLTWLDVPVRSASSVSSWLRLLFCRCDLLEQLSISVERTEHWTEQPQELLFEPAEAGDVLTLPRLRWLSLERLPLTNGGLLSVLSRCPELEYCSLFQLTHVTPAGQKAAWRCCPKLGQWCARHDRRCYCSDTP